MHACCSVSAACRPAETRRRRGEIVEIPIGEFSWVEFDPMGVRGLFNTIDEVFVYTRGVSRGIVVTNIFIVRERSYIHGSD